MSRAYLLILSIILFCTSCDVIDDPTIKFEVEYNEEVYGPPPVLTVTEQTGKNVLVEDFTAHQCGACPAAAIIAEELVENNGGKVFAIAIHAGNLAFTNDEYPTDWPCEEGNAFWDQLDFQANPVGRVNRMDDPGDYFSPEQWSDLVSLELEKSTPIELAIETEWDSNAENLNIHVYGEYFSSDSDGEDIIIPSGDHRLSILISESHLIGDQKDYSQDPEHVVNYEFNHLLRSSLTGHEGLTVISNPVSGDSFQSDFTFSWDDNLNINNCEIVAIVSDENGSIINCLGHYIFE